MTPEELLARLIYRDGLMLVIDKPAGIPVHRGPRNRADKSGANLEDYFGALRFGLPRNPALAHRLDRDTSGCLVLGRHRKALERLGQCFKQGKVAKTYWAIVETGPVEEEGLIDLALGRLDSSRGWWMKADPLGQPAQTGWRVLGRADYEGKPIAWLAMEPLTGRTHQLRVHAASMGWPIVGDPVYGAGGPGGPPLHLHAREVIVPIQKNKEPVRVAAPVPAHMGDRLAACGWAGEEAQAD